MRFESDADMNKQLLEHLNLALRWLANTACNRENRPIGSFGAALPYREWRGAMRGEYCAATGIWDSFCPYWHTGQAMKAFVAAAQRLRQPELLSQAEFCAGFLQANQYQTGADEGLFPAYESRPDEINTSAILESLDGLFRLAEATGKQLYQDSALKALNWVAEKAWMPEEGLFRDIYDSREKIFRYDTPAAQNRPLLDDAVFLTGWRLTGEKRYREIALRTAETLLQHEKPAGNWIRYIPCDIKNNLLHPRHAYWWGYPMLELFRETGDERFRDCFHRAAQWYFQALRTDGGMLRDTDSSFGTSSFGHASSASACAARILLAAAREFNDEQYLQKAKLALNFCCRMQFTQANDPNLQGAILEKVLFPDGSDRSPYYLRDLGTIFFVQAAVDYLD